MSKVIPFPVRTRLDDIQEMSAEFQKPIFTDYSDDMYDAMFAVRKDYQKPASDFVEVEASPADHQAKFDLLEQIAKDVKEGRA
jgi:hypothetical protein